METKVFVKYVIWKNIFRVRYKPGNYIKFKIKLKVKKKPCKLGRVLLHQDSNLRREIRFEIREVSNPTKLSSSPRRLSAKKQQKLGQTRLRETAWDMLYFFIITVEASFIFH